MTGRKTPTKTPRRKPRHGRGELMTGNPGNKGGGRLPDAFRQTLAAIRDEEGLPVLRQILSGSLTATAPAMGKRPARAVKPSADTRLRVIELLLKHTLPVQKEVRLAGGIDGTAVAFDCIKHCIRARLSADEAINLITSIEEALSEL